MTTLERRLRRVEAVLVDSSRLTPHSPEWVAYWDRWYYLRLTGGEPDKHARMDLVEVLRAVLNYDHPDSLFKAYCCRDFETITRLEGAKEAARSAAHAGLTLPVEPEWDAYAT